MKCRDLFCDNDANVETGFCDKCYKQRQRYNQEYDAVIKHPMPRGAEGQFNEMPRDFNHRATWTPMQIMQVITDLCLIVPKCPDCGREQCIDYMERYLKWVMRTVMSPNGFMAMFMADLQRKGGYAEYTKEELRKANNVHRVESFLSDDGQERTRVEIREEAIEPDPDWPMEVEDNGFSN